MKKIEREILHRMHCLLTAAPLPITGGGTQSASTMGFVSFGQDMAEMRPHLDNAWACFNYGDYEEAKILLSAIESWIEMRRGQNWALPSSLFRKEIVHFKREIEQQKTVQESEACNE